MFSGLYIFVDQANGFIIVKHQVTINSTENVKNKLIFDTDTKSQGVVTKVYHTGNWIFNAS